jgi:hypothetical protein
MRYDEQVARTVSRRPAQLDLALNSGADLDPEDQVKGRRGMVFDEILSPASVGSAS